MNNCKLRCATFVIVLAFSLTSSIPADESTSPKPTPAAPAATPAEKTSAPTPSLAPTARAAIETVLRTQQDAWNRGDIPAFMEGYWKSDNLTFSNGGKTTRGWQPTLDRYRKHYPTRESMGRLTFTNLEVTPLGDTAALVLGQWHLARDNEPLTGNFTLIFRNTNNHWQIIHDHSSRLAE